MAKKTTIKKADLQEPKSPEQTNQEPKNQEQAEPPKAATQTTGEPIGEVTTKPDPKKKPVIKKNNTREDAKPKEPQVTHMDAPDANPTPSADPQDQKQLGTKEAIAYAMTTPNPMATARRLAAQRRLVSVTNVYKELENLGHK